MIDRRNFLIGACTLAGGVLLPAQAATQARPIRMGYFDNYPPFSFRGRDGQMTGALVDGVDLLGQAAGLDFDHQGYPWARAQAMVEAGTLDGFCTVLTKPRQVYAAFCPTPIISVRFGIYHRIDDPRPLSVRSVADLRTLRQGKYIGAGYSAENLEPNYIQWFKDEETVLRMIDANRLDIYIEGEVVTSRKLQQLGLANRFKFTPAPFLPPVNFCFGLRRNFPDANAILARMEVAAQAARKSGALDANLARYR
ncbi:substrate-binding periplasmic protein [Andreprevotia chitinilytica]|uniref:substrate-binding periplasmic protein n=1 Tax=Andreprevotia chitinilytica TaxID=396808 RepID=UPI000556AF36|nr:transporter substrate-binding domain-containing protein [Andreprevotia chitinilytica]